MKQRYFWHKNLQYYLHAPTILSFLIYKYPNKSILSSKFPVWEKKNQEMGFLKVTILLLFSFTILFPLSLSQNTPQDYVAAHNKVRTPIGLKPLTWNTTLVQYAQNYANQRSVDCELIHSDGPYGENLAEASWDLTAAEAVQMWADEKPFYNYLLDSCVPGEMCGHYTQIVWRDTATVGCAKVICTNNKWSFVICNYDPPGNYIGERPF